MGLRDEHEQDRNNMKTRMLLLMAACAVLTSGCLMQNMGTLQEATKPIEQGKYTVIGDRVSGADIMWVGPFGITDGRPGSPAMRALDRAMDKAEGADALIEVSENVETYAYYPFPIFQIITRVTGTPVKEK